MLQSYNRSRELKMYEALLAYAAIPKKNEQVAESTKKVLNNIIRITQPATYETMDKKNDIDKLIEQYHEMFGRPGEPRYEAMLESLEKEMRIKTPEELAAEREAFRARAKVASGQS